LGTLTGLLADDDEDIRIEATLALAQAGSAAAMAVPGLEKLLTKKADAQKHTFLSHQAAAYALMKIGKAGAPALIRATGTRSGDPQDAILNLGLLGKDAPPEAVDCLIRILETGERGGCGYGRRSLAAIALGSLGEHARRARQALEDARPDDFHMVMAVSWALMEVGTEQSRR
jgi:HEAT repeat protein